MKQSIRRNLILPAGALLALVILLGSTYSAQKKVRACRITVEGEVNGVMLTTIQRRIDMALERGVEVIFFEIDSYGGRVDFAESIAHMIDTTTGVKKVAYIPNKAISAGAFIALSCDEIVMHPRATLGDCQPVFPSMTGPPKPAGEKMESAFRGKMVAYAQDENRNYPVALTKAMVSPRIEVLRIPGAEGLPHEFVEREDLYSWSETKLRDLQIFEESDTFSGGDERRRFVVIVDGEEVSIPIIVDEGEILTMHGEEAMEYGFARLLVDNLEELVSLYELKSEEVGYLPVLWWENFVKL
ncbi:MAG: hypothetical protein O6952_09905, partial [Planctomycetota bacterium]|nr:hypothetical protein [Planctomycetota bacterium]